MTELQVESFDRLESIGHSRWNELWARTEVPSIFARFEWATSWWRNFGSDSHLHVLAATRNGKLVGILPTVWSESRNRCRIGLVGEEHSDYAGILTDPEVPQAFPKLLDELQNAAPRDAQIELADVRNDTSYFEHLDSLTRQSWSAWTYEEEMLCPRASLDGDKAAALANKSSLRRKARKLAALGEIVVEHFDNGDDIRPQLPGFFQQHIDRWANTDFPSLFLKNKNRSFYSDLVVELSDTELLVFTVVSLNNDPVAFHFGFLSERDFIWYKPTFNPGYSKVSPGEVLIRELLMMASELGVEGFDFTRGDEAFKMRFSDEHRFVRTFVRHSSRAAAARQRYTDHAKDFLRKYLPARMVSVIGEIRGSHLFGRASR